MFSASLPATSLEAQADLDFNLDRLSLPTEPDRPFHHGRLLLSLPRWSGHPAPPDNRENRGAAPVLIREPAYCDILAV